MTMLGAWALWSDEALQARAPPASSPSPSEQMEGLRQGAQVRVTLGAGGEGGSPTTILRGWGNLTPSAFPGVWLGVPKLPE